MFRILVPITVNGASGEKSFSKLKQIVSYLSTSHSRGRLCRPAVLSIEKDAASKMNYTALTAEFAAMKARKVTFLHFM